MGAFLSSSSSKDAGSGLSQAAGYLRGLLGFLAVACLVLLVILGIVFLIAGIIVGAAAHWSGFLVGGVLSIACIVGAIMLWDAWGTASLGLCLFELASCPKDELAAKLKMYSERNKVGMEDDSAATDQTIKKLCEKVADTILSKFTMLFQWGPLIFTVVAILCCVLAVVIEDAPAGLLIASIVAVVVGVIASIIGNMLMCCLFTPMVEGQVKSAIDPYVDSLQKRLGDDLPPPEAQTLGLAQTRA